MEWTTCPDPDCRAPAEVQWRAAVASTDAPVELAKVLCLHRHSFLLPVAMLATSDTYSLRSEPLVSETTQPTPDPGPGGASVG